MHYQVSCFHCFARENKFENLKIVRHWKKQEKPAQKERNCNDVCKVCHVNLKVTYGKSVAIKSLWKYIQTVGEKTNKKLINETLSIACR